MAPDDKDRPTALSRRQMLKGVGLAGAAATVVAPSAPAVAAPQPAKPKPEALEQLTAVEAATLEAVCARLIPSDDGAPGAAEARAAHYIDRALGGALAASREAYRAGLSSLNASAQTARGKAFAALPAAEQDALLKTLETGSPAFFNLVRAHTLQGTFCDPYYGGNANFVGWDMVAYPGVRMGATPQQQAMNAHTAPNHASAYDYDMFAKVTPTGATLASAGGAQHDH
jgi:gluconate 2-dehydrogenase gamma chain